MSGDPKPPSAEELATVIRADLNQGYASVPMHRQFAECVATALESIAAKDARIEELESVIERSKSSVEECTRDREARSEWTDTATKALAALEKRCGELRDAVTTLLNCDCFECVAKARALLGLDKEGGGR